MNVKINNPPVDRATDLKQSVRTRRRIWRAESIEWFMEGQDLRSPPLSRQQVFLSVSLFRCVAVRAYWQERWEGLGEEPPPHTTASKPDPLSIIPYSLLRWVSRKAGRTMETPLYIISRWYYCSLDCGLLPISHFVMREEGQWLLLQGIPMLCATDRSVILDSHFQVVLAFTVWRCLGAWRSEKEHIKYSISITFKKLSDWVGESYHLPFIE